MNDPFDPPAAPGRPTPETAHEPERLDPPAEPYPWEADPPPEEELGPDGRRPRHDGFTEAKKCAFLKALTKTGAILDACRLVGVSARTVYRHQQGDPAFFDNCVTAIRMSATPVELIAWKRAVDGVEQEFACGGQVHVRRRYDGSLLRLLLQGSNPKKYGSRPGFTRKQILRHERKRMEREIRAELEESLAPPTFDEAMVQLDKALDAFNKNEEPKKLAAGWTKSPDGHWIPPGYGPIPGWTPSPGAAEDGEAPGDSM